MRYREIHKAQCSNCNYVDLVSDEGNFIRAFFLPSLCPKCGEYMATGYNIYGGNDKPHWKHVIVKEELQPSKREFLKISTWLSGPYWKEVDRTEMRA